MNFIFLYAPSFLNQMNSEKNVADNLLFWAKLHA